MEIPDHRCGRSIDEGSYRANGGRGGEEVAGSIDVDALEEQGIVGH